MRAAFVAAALSFALSPSFAAAAVPVPGSGGDGTLPVPPADEARAPPAGPCLLPQAGSDRARVAQCVACHPACLGGHKVGIPYAAARTARAALRPEAEVVRSGVFLPGGELRCTTCHDGRSQVAFRLALPPGAELRAAVVRGDAETYEQRPPIASAALAPGQRVSAKQLCLACHLL